MKKGVLIKSKYITLSLIILVAVILSTLSFFFITDSGKLGYLFDFVYGPTQFSYGDCVPQCDGKVCGSDGCGRQCGSCPFGETCSPNSAFCIKGASPPVSLPECPLVSCLDGSSISGAYNHNLGKCVYDDCPGTNKCPIIDCFSDVLQGCTPNPVKDANGCTLSCGEPICEKDKCIDSECNWQEKCECDSGSENPIVNGFLDFIGDVFGGLGDVIGLDLTPGKCKKTRTCDPIGDCDVPEPKIFVDLDFCGDKNCDKNKLNLDSCVCSIVDEVKSCYVKKIPVDDDCEAKDVVDDEGDTGAKPEKGCGDGICDNGEGYLCVDPPFDCTGDCLTNPLWGCNLVCPADCGGGITGGVINAFASLPDNFDDTIVKVDSCDNLCNSKDDCSAGECVNNQCVDDKKKTVCEPSCSEGQSCVLGVCVYDENLKCPDVGGGIGGKTITKAHGIAENEKLELADGSYEYVSEIKEGDLVACVDNNNEKTSGKVLEVKLPTTGKDQVEIIFENNEKIKLTKGVEVKLASGWIKIESLRPGNILLFKDGENQKVKEVKVIPESDTTRYYHFVVEGCHNLLIFVSSTIIIRDAEPVSCSQITTKPDCDAEPNCQSVYGPDGDSGEWKLCIDASCTGELFKGVDVCSEEEICPGADMGTWYDYEANIPKFYEYSSYYDKQGQLINPGRCCRVDCELPDWDICTECGRSSYNSICDRTECNSITETLSIFSSHFDAFNNLNGYQRPCYFSEFIGSVDIGSGTCYRCSAPSPESTMRCEDYLDPLTCNQDPCGLNCEFDGGSCVKKINVQQQGCQSALDCNDNVACTADSCSRNGVCSNEPNNWLCPSGQTCDAVQGCIGSISICDNGICETGEEETCPNDNCYPRYWCNENNQVCSQISVSSFVSCDECENGDCVELSNTQAKCLETTCRTDSECQDRYQSCDYECDQSTNSCVRLYTDVFRGSYPNCGGDCSTCGGTLLDANICDRTECEGLDLCYFVNTFGLGGDCNSCSRATCTDYNGDSQSCRSDVCSIRNCEFSGGSCVSKLGCDPFNPCMDDNGNEIKECGSWDNGCGTNVNCGICDVGTCNNLGQCVAEGCIDLDNDGYDKISANCQAGTDCNDNDANTYPGATENCDGVDSDCDGLDGSLQNNVVCDESKISFLQGWNFVSIGRDVKNKEINALFSNFDDYIEYILEWDEQKQEFKYNSKKGEKDFTKLKKEKSYFIYSNEAFLFDYEGNEIKNLNINLVKGWNSPVYPLLTFTDIEGENKFHGVEVEYVSRWNNEKQEFEVYSSEERNKLRINPSDGIFLYTKGGTIKYTDI